MPSISLTQKELGLIIFCMNYCEENLLTTSEIETSKKIHYKLVKKCRGW